MVGKTWRLEWLLATGVKLLVYNWTDPEAETGQETGQSVTPNACPTEIHVLHTARPLYRLCHLLGSKC